MAVKILKETEIRITNQTAPITTTGYVLQASALSLSCTSTSADSSFCRHTVGSHLHENTAFISPETFFQALYWLFVWYAWMFRRYLYVYKHFQPNFRYWNVVSQVLPHTYIAQLETTPQRCTFHLKNRSFKACSNYFYLLLQETLTASPCSGILLIPHLAYSSTAFSLS